MFYLYKACKFLAAWIYSFGSTQSGLCVLSLLSVGAILSSNFISTLSVYKKKKNEVAFKITIRCEIDQIMILIK
jgi:hypothetical protein